MGFWCVSWRQELCSGHVVLECSGVSSGHEHTNLARAVISATSQLEDLFVKFCLSGLLQVLLPKQTVLTFHLIFLIKQSNFHQFVNTAPLKVFLKSAAMCGSKPEICVCWELRRMKTTKNPDEKCWHLANNASELFPTSIFQWNKNFVTCCSSSSSFHSSGVSFSFTKWVSN